MSNPPKPDASNNRDGADIRQHANDLLTRMGMESGGVFDSLLDEEDPSSDLAEALRVRFLALGERHVFQPGDLVTWKPGFANKSEPARGRPAVVVAVLDSPIHDRCREAGLTYYREPLDIVLGVLIEKGEHRGAFLTWHYDSRRFMPYRAA